MLWNAGLIDCRRVLATLQPRVRSGLEDPDAVLRTAHCLREATLVFAYRAAPPSEKREDEQRFRIVARPRDAGAPAVAAIRIDLAQRLIHRLHRAAREQQAERQRAERRGAQDAP